jgi:hypothetical protein
MNADRFRVNMSSTADKRGYLAFPAHLGALTADLRALRISLLEYFEPLRIRRWKK